MHSADNAVCGYVRLISARWLTAAVEVCAAYVCVCVVSVLGWAIPNIESERKWYGRRVKEWWHSKTVAVPPNAHSFPVVPSWAELSICWLLELVLLVLLFPLLLVLHSPLQHHSSSSGDGGTCLPCSMATSALLVRGQQRRHCYCSRVAICPPRLTPNESHQDDNYSATSHADATPLGHHLLQAFFSSL